MSTICGFLSRIQRIVRARKNVDRILQAQNVTIRQGQIYELLWVFRMLKCFEIHSGHRLTMSNLLRIQKSLLFFNRRRSAHVILGPVAFVHPEFLLRPQRSRPFAAKRFPQRPGVAWRKVIIAQFVKLSWCSSTIPLLKRIHLIDMSFDLFYIRLHNPVCQPSLI